MIQFIRSNEIKSIEVFTNEVTRLNQKIQIPSKLIYNRKNYRIKIMSGKINK
jgi:hypothetical protein